jgi:hypothetical protein
LLGACFALMATMAAAPLSAHLAWPTHHSAKTTITLRGDDLRIAVAVEIPLDQLVLAFNEFFAQIDIFAEIEKGRSSELEAEFRQAQFERLAQGLELTLDSATPAGSWQPADTPINGKASEGFFIYILEWQPRDALALGKSPNKRPDQRADKRSGRRLDVTVRNRLFAENSVVFANLVATEGWRLLDSSTPQPSAGADLTLGSEAEAALWSDDPQRRSFTVVLERQD